MGGPLTQVCCHRFPGPSLFGRSGGTQGPQHGWAPKAWRGAPIPECTAGNGVSLLVIFHASPSGLGALEGTLNLRVPQTFTNPSAHTPLYRRLLNHHVP